jgi:hypothetical protein
MMVRWFSWNLPIDRKNRSAVFDFTGTGKTNATDHHQERNSLLSEVPHRARTSLELRRPHPVRNHHPDGTILSVSKEAAVVGGNVKTSQKLVDIILKPFNGSLHWLEWHCTWTPAPTSSLSKAIPSSLYSLDSVKGQFRLGDALVIIFPVPCMWLEVWFLYLLECLLVTRDDETGALKLSIKI